MARLQYEPSLEARPVVVEEHVDVIRIIVPMRGPYFPTPEWVWSLDVLSIFIGPIWMVGTVVIRTILRLPKPPRAVFEISLDRVKLMMQDPGGGVKAFDWPRQAVLEARVNRYDKGFWLHVTDHVKETYLQDLPRPTLEKLEAALNEVLNKK
jgi:hypothetical protein